MKRTPLTPEQIQHGIVETVPFDDPHSPQWQTAVRQGTLQHNTIACGVMRHPRTKLHQVWISLYGTDVTSFVAFTDRARALAVAERIQSFVVTWAGEQRDPQTINDFLTALHQESDAKPVPFPDSAIRSIAGAIQRTSNKCKE